MKKKDKALEIKRAQLKTEKITLSNAVSDEWRSDPKHLSFSLSRYKFVSKMLEGYNKVLEVGAGDGFKSDIIFKVVKNLTLCEYNNLHIKEYQGNAKYIVHDFVKGRLKNSFDGIYAIDVLEHIDKKKENIFIKNILLSLNKNGILIFGMPTIESQKYASKLSKIGHVNCKSKNSLRKLMQNFFHNVFMFSMNDEMVHTGYDKMSHFIFAVCANKKK